jgi:putative chitinase
MKDMNINVLRDIIPQEAFDEIDECIKHFHIHSPLRLAHFLAQVSHESGNFRWKTENLNYSKEALMSVFRKYFPTEAIAAQYARKPEMIANRAYGNRMGNGDEASGDGWRYRGRGYIQLTGKNNYAAFNSFVEEDIVLNPELVADKYPMLSAAWYWKTNNLNAIADRGNDDDVVMDVTRKINGGLNGIYDRLKKFEMFYNKLV